MIDQKSFVVVNNDQQPTLKDMIYGGSKPVATTVVLGNLYRLRRGFPLQRAGKLVVATPQFKTLTLYSPTNATQQIKGTTVTPVSLTYPK